MNTHVFMAILAAGLFAFAGLQMAFYSTSAPGLEQPIRALGWFSFGMSAFALRVAAPRPKPTP